MDLFLPGRTILKRDVYSGKIWNAWPKRVISDDGDILRLALMPGTRGLVPESWIVAARTGDPVAHQQILADLMRNEWTLKGWIWRDNTVLSTSASGRYFGVDLYFDQNRDLLFWYVNFQTPLKRDAQGIETFDLLLDMIVYPDFHREWKDEEEYALARRFGIISDRDHLGVQNACEEVLALLSERRGPFNEQLRRWEGNPRWPVPSLPPSFTSMAQD